MSKFWADGYASLAAAPVHKTVVRESVFVGGNDLASFVDVTIDEDDNEDVLGAKSQPTTIRTTFGNPPVDAQQQAAATSTGEDTRFSHTIALPIWRILQKI